MAERSGLRRATGSIGTAPDTSFQDEWYGRRMQLLMQSGAGRFLDDAPETLIALASSNRSDIDMLDNYMRAHNQADFAQMRHTFEAMPDQLQKAEFKRLPEATQQVLISGGYEPPNEEEKALWKRILTWDIPLLPEEHLGQAIGIGMAPIRAMGFFAGKAASNAWEYGVMKPSRLATRWGRSGAYLGEKGGSSFFDPAQWREAWNAAKLEENSYYSGTVDKAINIVGDRQTDLLRSYLEGGHQAVYDNLLAEGELRGASTEEINQIWKNWQENLSEESNVRAIEILESGKLTLFDASIRAFNHTSPWDVTPDSIYGKTVGMVGSLAVEILLDPTTWGGGALFKISKALKHGLRVGNTHDAIDFSRRVSMALRSEDKAGMFAPVTIWNPTLNKHVDALEEVKEWVFAGAARTQDPANIVGRGSRYLAATNWNIRANHKAMNRFIDRVNDAFRRQDELDEFAAVLRKTDPDANIHDAIVEEFGDGYNPIGQLMRDLPALGAIMGDMWNWHNLRRRLSLTVPAKHIDADGMWKVFDDKGELLAEARIKGGHGDALEEGDNVFVNDGIQVTTVDGEVIDFQSRTFPTLAHEQGYWDFLSSQSGWEALATPLGKTDMEAIYLPRIGKFGEQWIKGKRYMREVLDFKHLDEGIRADMARLTATYLAKQTNWVHKNILDDIQSGAMTLSNDVDATTLRNLMEDTTSNNARKLGFNEADLEKIDEARFLYEEDAALRILEDGEMDDLLKWYQADGYEIQRVGKRGKPELVIKADRTVPFGGWRKARQNYWEGQIHKAGGTNAELDWWTQTGIIAKTAAASIAYYPARFAEKLTTYVPKVAHLDVTDSATAISEFQGLVDMGIMVDMSRTQIDNYLRAYTMGNDSERWLVTTEFYLDFLGRSGALLHGGRDVQRFVEKFIRHGAHRYGNITDDMVGLHGLNVRRAITPGQEYSAQLARSSVIPDYRELGSVARYMAFYRKIGWGLHLPAVDAALAKTWRPAVLLRLGYVVRNGGEELFSWWLREGMGNYGKQKLAKTAADFHSTYDKYGRKIMVKGADLPESERLPMLWKPFAGLWRSFNEVAGVGDYAITTKALRQAVKENPQRWKWLTEQQREEIFEATREAVELKTGRSVIGRTSKQMLEFANAQANRLSLLGRDVLDSVPGMVTRQKLAGRLLKRWTKDHAERVEAVAESLTIPTLLDAQMKDVLGTFDNYLNYNKNTMDSVMRQGNSVESMDRLVKLTVDYQNTELAWISNEPGTEIDSVYKSQAVSQRLAVHADDEFARAYLNELSHYVTPIIRQQLKPITDELVIAATSRNPALMGSLLAGQTPEQIVLRLAREHDTALNELRRTFDLTGPGSTYDDAGNLVVSDLPFEAGWPDAVDNFIEQMPVGERRAWQKLLDPQVDGQSVGADVNTIAFILSDAQPLRLTDDWDEAVRRGRQAYVNKLMTPYGQDVLRSFHRSNMGFSQLGGKMSEPLPPGATRLFVPMLPKEYQRALVELLALGGKQRKVWADEMVDLLIPKFAAMGLPESEALKAVRMLQPASKGTHQTTTSMVATASLWDELGESYFPIATGSANDRVALAISQTLEDVLDRRLGAGFIGPRPGHEAGRGRIGELTVNSEELWNAPGLSQGSRPDELNITVMRNGVATTTNQNLMATALGGEYMNNYYGWDKGKTLTPREFGPRGLRDENIIGIAGSHLLSPVGGLTPVPMVDGAPMTYMTRVYQHPKTGQHVILRAGDERPDEWFFDYELVEEQITAGNDIRAVAEQIAIQQSIELNDLLGTGSRQDYKEVFHPWIREVLSGNEVSDIRVGAYAHQGRWWNKAPSDILAFVPVTEEGGRIGEKISKAWTSVLRNWFDGVVNPMIGAMVREPLFQNYLAIAKGQTVGVRRIYHRPMVERGGWGEEPKHLEPFDAELMRRLKIGRMDADDQYVIEELEGFIKFDWPLSKANPDEPSSLLAAAIEIGSPDAAGDAIRLVLAQDDIPNDVKRVWTRLGKLMEDPVIRPIEGETAKKTAARTLAAFERRTKTQEKFFSWAKHRKLMNDAHQVVSARRAMTLSASYIDDHRIRSQFQQMVGTVIPFWFAEDNFLRRVGRGLKQNPLMFRNLHLTMNAGVYSGIVQEDQFGEKKIVIPGSEVATHAMLSIADELPVINSVFGGDLGSVARPGMGIAMNINVIPGYDLESIGKPGFGPLLAAPINFASGRDPEIRQMFEHNLVGGRYAGVSKLDTGHGSTVMRAGEAVWSSVVPALLARTIALAGIDGPNGEARAKAKIDVLKFMAMNGSIPTEQEIASHANPALFEEAFLEDVDMMARQYQLLQAMTWFFGPATGSLADLTLHENWEWNQEFHELLEMGLPYEEAYPSWVKNIEARTGEKFDPVEHSPFRTSAYQKIPFAVLETTQDANRWLVDNEDFARDFTMASSFFMPRRFDVEDDEYVAEAKQRQVNMGLRRLNAPEEFLSELYFNISYPIYNKHRTTYLARKNAMRARNMDTAKLDQKYDLWYASFQLQHPVFVNQITTGTARIKRDATVNEFRLLVESPELVPEGLHREDILNAMATIVGFADKMDSLSGLTDPNARAARDAVRYKYMRVMETFAHGKPWLNELYYSVFMPILGESWVAKHQAGLVNIDMRAMV